MSRRFTQDLRKKFLERMLGSGRSPARFVVSIHAEANRIWVTCLDTPNPQPKPDRRYGSDEEMF